LLALTLIVAGHRICGEGSSGGVPQTLQIAANVIIAQRYESAVVVDLRIAPDRARSDLTADVVKALKISADRGVAYARVGWTRAAAYLHITADRHTPRRPYGNETALDGYYVANELC
jgi:hypothetical protein